MFITPAQKSVLNKVANGNNTFGLDKTVIHNLNKKGLVNFTSSLVHNRGGSSYWLYTVTLTDAGKAAL